MSDVRDVMPGRKVKERNCDVEGGDGEGKNEVEGENKTKGIYLASDVKNVIPERT